MNSLLRQGKARPKFEKFKAIVARFSGLNVKREENEIGSQVFANHKHVLYHYEFAPQNRNGTLLDSSVGHPFIEASEIEDDTDIFVSIYFENFLVKLVLGPSIGRTRR